MLLKNCRCLKGTNFRWLIFQRTYNKYFLFSSNSFPFWHRLSSFEDERGFESIETPAAGANSQQEMMPLLRQANQFNASVATYGATRRRRKPLQNFMEHKVVKFNFAFVQRLQLFEMQFSISILSSFEFFPLSKRFSMNVKHIGKTRVVSVCKRAKIQGSKTPNLIIAKII